MFYPDARFKLFQILLGQKYGDYILPPEIPAEEFENFILAGRMYSEKQMRFIRQSIADIEATRAERERLRQLEAAATTTATTAAPESITAPTADVTSADIREPGDTRPSAEDEVVLPAHN